MLSEIPVTERQILYESTYYVLGIVKIIETELEMVVARSSKRNQGTKGVAFEVVELIYRSRKAVPCDVDSVLLWTIRMND